MVWEGETANLDDTLIAATIKVNAEYAKETLGDVYTDDELTKLLEEAVDEINKELPYFKKIKKLYLRKDDFDSTTSKKIKRFVPENRIGIEI